MAWAVKISSASASTMVGAGSLPWRASRLAGWSWTRSCGGAASMAEVSRALKSVGRKPSAVRMPSTENPPR